VITATPAVVAVDVVCEDCSKVIAPGARASCLKCCRELIESAEDDARTEAAKEHTPAGKAIREWATRRHLLGQISAEVRAELELCAEDIECGHG
jgi:hypothetical protein